MQVPVRWVESVALPHHPIVAPPRNALGGTLSSRAGTGRADVDFDVLEEVPG